MIRPKSLPTFVAAAGLIALTQQGCHPVEQSIQHSEFYTFVVGPKSDWTKGNDRRFVIRIPGRFVELTADQKRQDRIEVGQFTFAVHFPSGEPVRHDELGTAEVLLITVSWDPGDGVKQRVDGSWPNYYSRYSVRTEQEGDLQEFKSSESYDDSRLFVSLDKHVLIECPHIVGHQPMPCRLMSNDGGNRTIGIRFDRALLPKWKPILALTNGILSEKTVVKGK